MSNKIPSSIWRNPIHFLAFGLGSGAAPKAPGTFGTLAAIPLYLLMQDLSNTVYFAVLVITSIVGIYLCGKTSKDLGVHDHSGIVWDEFVGYWITMWMAPTGWEYIIVGFVLFRFFDVLKPWPISFIDKRVHGGFGIMLDDIIAGIFAFALLQLYVVLA
ncbi:phosphatidylglycerophosphatase A [Marinomonas mediterranea]|jgi:phosphatidylglycerophosphatase (EC 3.1.3.27)|uniref:Phosphatidylglycerophosphatase A n=1 Tax=Marinomonas mediterranea (strain ATCC 700492 / JCM 21426 / NBRC 103028 / MMB-1) TaxID=717774 RepID=F2JZL6_MARM1|nr:phosphatidylglycerophosphatase A [Marinomonas mediterranea]ADZ89799.1 Phosphatidylglycerophosphatase [Marinomonas mediterranea MMB-1]WCN07888.1 phosphatidylglycerophosphatase A [Marinomonas mediterranea]WCN11983.1 phosphatidylglycerophosphatase A [Marinomonas mediterranea]WCN16020.1 phosphatidylglycerophosphatase A [Marinomonas mediterranea MMB-1]